MLDETTRPRKPRSRNFWQLDRTAWDALLTILGPDREAAGARYEDLRRRLVDMFAWERCEAPDELADEVLNRLARKVMERTEIPHLERFALGIARFVAQEERRKKRHRETALREIQLEGAPDDSKIDGWNALESCLSRLPPDRRELIQRYYAEDRTSLARSLGISTNALRNRAMRIREELFDCARWARDNS